MKKEDRIIGEKIITPEPDDSEIKNFCSEANRKERRSLRTRKEHTFHHSAVPFALKKLGII